MSNCVVIEEHATDPNAVRTGSRITVKDVATGEEETYQVVGSQEADPMNGRISEESPWQGAAGQGHRRGGGGGGSRRQY